MKLLPEWLECWGKRTGSFKVIEANSSHSYSVGDDSYAPNSGHSTGRGKCTEPAGSQDNQRRKLCSKIACYFRRSRGLLKAINCRTYVTAVQLQLSKPPAARLRAVRPCGYVPARAAAREHRW